LKTSLKDIAEKLQLSKTSVSWVLSGQGDAKGISRGTQERVYQCAKDLNYQPNLLARSLNTGSTCTIGLILPSISDLFYSQVAKEIEMEAEKFGYSLMICSSESEISREDRMIRMFKAKQVDGIIIAPTKHSKVEILQLINESYPFILFDRYFPELPVNSVLIDNEESSYKLVKHLVDKGCKKIAVITTNTYLTTLNLRYEGYLRALFEAGIPSSQLLYGAVEYFNYEQNIDNVLDKIFRAVPDVDGFFFTTHILALEGFRYFNEKNIDINQGYGMACIHETSAFHLLAPEMSIARMPVEGIGKNAIRLLLDEIKTKQSQSSGVSKDKNQNVLILPCTLDLN
jgi:LacI family transcriptional regulator